MSNCVGFDPVARADARVLILGTLPGAESLRRMEYYAKKQNSFWRIMETLTGAKAAAPYGQRLKRLMKQRIALWDVCASAYRVGSLDQKIRLDTLVPNDFSAFFKRYKKVELICFNGQAAERLFQIKVMPGLPMDMIHFPRVILPSTSPAHAGMNFERKLSLWRQALDPFMK